jgi:hypothetical protein
LFAALAGTLIVKGPKTFVTVPSIALSVENEAGVFAAPPVLTMSGVAFVLKEKTLLVTVDPAVAKYAG